VPHPFFDVPHPTVIGHRGCAGEAPENTLNSFQRALEVGAAILESDVHLTRDDVPVLLHDDEVDRNTDGSGRVAELTFARVQELDAGYRFSPDGGHSHPFRGRGLRIPSLREALEACPGARFNLELKEHLPGLVEKTLEVVCDAGRESLTLLTAAEDPLMAELRTRVEASGAGVALGACTGDVLDFIRSATDGSAPKPGPMALQVPAEFGGNPLVTPAFIDHAHAHGIVVHVWTINEIDEMESLLDLGVDGLVTDYPGRPSSKTSANA
jgi:glycerophosphoryl diester phosphodiesterase